MPAIRALPEDVASRIAAGEVIERPASVLKELLENAVDAGAKKISVEVQGAGKTLMRVADDGCGMAEKDCRLAFARHATSKIKKLEDIDALTTFGFRGEALFSIAAVAKVTLSSSTKGARTGWKIEMYGGKLKKEQPTAPVKGTVIEVRDLFFNTPARKKFLKSDPSERSHLSRVVEETALANPGIAFTFKNEKRTLLQFAARNNAKMRVADVLGDKGSEFIKAEGTRGGLDIRAFLSPIDDLRPSRGLQYVFVNKRPVTNRTVSQALYRAYEPFRDKNRHPAAVVFINVPPGRLDVNVHPTKREVRFLPEGAVFDAVTKTLSAALLETKGIPTLDKTARHDFGVWKPLGPGKSAPTEAPRGARGQQLDLGAATAVAEPAHSNRKVGTERAWHNDGLRFLGQIERSYLLFEDDGGVLVIDQHAAQEKILFEKYLGQIESGKLATQKLMLPQPVSLPASAVQKVLAQKKRIKRAGFSIEAYGKTKLHVTEAPAVFAKATDIEDVIHHLIDGLLSPKAATADARYDATATIACKAAVKAHDPLSADEALQLLHDLRQCADPTACPHGRPSMLALDRNELARRFERPGAPPRHR
jgi:DNA mismatch repair protein MutL